MSTFKLESILEQTRKSHRFCVSRVNAQKPRFGWVIYAVICSTCLRFAQKGESQITDKREMKYFWAEFSKNISTFIYPKKWPFAVNYDPDRIILNIFLNVYSIFFFLFFFFFAPLLILPFLYFHLAGEWEEWFMFFLRRSIPSYGRRI